MYVLAVGYSPQYLAENRDGVRDDWPRVPLPNTHEALLASADLGSQIAALLDSDNKVPGIDTGSLRVEMKVVALPSRVGGGSLNPDAGEHSLTVGWGRLQRNAVMPGQGKVREREYTPEERVAIEEGATALGLSAEAAFSRLGETTFDVYLNEVAYWRNVPKRVWGYAIGGYRPIKKWLSYRELEILDRSLSSGEIREVRDMTRRIAAILLVEPDLDANYMAAKANCYDWPSPEGSS
jgi:hypothetical protein